MSDKKISNSFKIILVGSAGVGKTSIIYNYTHNGKFEENPLSTISNSYTTKIININGKNIELQIWDTAGQEVYRSLTNIFYGRTNAVIFVYDTTRKSTFDEIKEYWYDNFLEFREENSVLALAGNKCELFDLEEVPEKDGEIYAEEKNLIFKLVSAYKSIGIEDLFEDIAYKLLGIEKIIEKEDKGKKLIEGNIDKSKKKKCC